MAWKKSVFVIVSAPVPVGMFQVALVPASDDVSDRASAVLLHGAAVLGRGWHSLADSQLSRKQLRIVADLDEGTLVATRLGGNPSRVARAAQPSAPPSDLPKDSPVPLLHGDTLFLVGSKLAFTVHIHRLPDASTAQAPIAATVPLDLDTLALVGLRASGSAGRDGSAVVSSIHNPRRLSRLESGEGASSQSPGRTITALAYEGASLPDDDRNADRVLAAEESRWTDDEDENEATAKNLGPSRSVRRQRLSRADFSDESEDYSMAGLCVELQATPFLTSDTDSDSIKPSLPQTPSKLKSHRENFTRAQHTPKSITTSRDNESTTEIKESSGISSIRPPNPEIRNSKMQSNDRMKLIQNLKEGKRKRQRTVAQARENEPQTRGGNEDENDSTVCTGISLQGVPKKNRRVTAYGLFSKQERRKLKRDNPSLGPSDVTKAVKSNFNRLDPADLLRLTDRATQLNNKAADAAGSRVEAEDLEDSEDSEVVASTPPKHHVSTENVVMVQDDSESDSAESAEIIL
ncbi:hypothetical protein HDU84_009302, partial [Entophlyctis sp. JEL0112]